MKKQSLIKTGFKMGFGFYLGWEIAKAVDYILYNRLKPHITNKVNEIKHKIQNTKSEESKKGFKIGFQPNVTE